LYRDMDRFYWVVANEHYLGETVIAQQSGVRLYNGEDRVSTLTTVALIVVNHNTDDV